MAARTKSETVLVQGRRRSYSLVIPTGPVTATVLVFHGSNQNGAAVRRLSGHRLDRLAEAGAVVAYPDGHRRGWNDARLQSTVPARRDGVDDVAFVRALVDTLVRRFGVDRRQVFAVGFSAGGSMVIRLLHEMPAELAGAAILSATQPAPGNLVRVDQPARPVPVVLLHGTQDRFVPYGGGMASLRGFRPRGEGLSAPATAAYFAARNGITAAPSTGILDGHGRFATERTDYRQAGHPPVTLYTVHGGGHTIPGPRRAPRLMGPTARDVDAAGLIAEFFGLPLPAGPTRSGTPSTAAVPPRRPPMDASAAGPPVPVLEVVVREPGGPEKLRLERAPRPAPGAGQVLVAVEAAGVAFGDVQRRQGRLPGRFPVRPGYDVVGRIVGTGTDAGPLAAGQRVAAFLGAGGYATEVIARADLCVPVPDDLDAARLDALVLNYVTAWQMLHRVAAVPAGGSILVLGAAGGVGTALGELAALDGITVHGTASPARRAALTSLGVIPVDDVTAVAEPVDATFDSVGGPSLARSRRATKKSGTVVAFGMSFASTRDLFRARGLAGALAALARARTTPGARVANFLIDTSVRKDPAAFRADLARLVDLLRSGRIDPRVTTVPLGDVVEAHQRLESRGVIGKLVLTVG